MGHLKYPYECTAISMSHEAVSMSKCTPVYAVYKVHPDSDYIVSHSLLGQINQLYQGHVLKSEYPSAL
jgi:hypothetical protein